MGALARYELTITGSTTMLLLLHSAAFVVLSFYSDFESLYYYTDFCLV